MPKRSTAPPPAPARVIGNVVRIVSERGFGFVRDGSGHEYFFHRSSCPEFEDLRTGTAVTFLPTESNKGLRAEAVEPA